MKLHLLEEALSLPLPERIELADEIYRSVDRETDETILPGVLAEMERRDAEHEANPTSGCTIEEVEKELFKGK
ncbi:MAG: addiction module protein [Verrucomicrobia bacterium]|jgi:putative addiction module component (TIGR02574 family)|nr:addiction module protein [Verrucomicrobiota bacterium]